MKVPSVKRKAAVRRVLLLAFSVAFSHVAGGADNRISNDTSPMPAPETLVQASTMKIRLKVDDKVLTATLIESETTRDFLSLLPLTLSMDDLFGREKFAHLPRPLSERGERRRTYEVGDVIYWSPGPDVAIFYRHDGQSIPPPGIIVIGKIDSGVEALNVPGSVRVTIELAE